MRLLIRHDDIHVIPRAQAVIRNRKQTGCVRRQIEASDFGTLVGHKVQKSGVLMREAVVILPPHQ